MGPILAMAAFAVPVALAGPAPIDVPAPDGASVEPAPVVAPPAPIELPEPARPSPGDNVSGLPAPTAAPIPVLEPVVDPPAVALGVDLVWRAAPGCPPPERVLAAVAALLDRAVELDPTGALVVRGDVIADGARFRLELDVDGPGGVERRSLDAERCDVVTEAAALVIATNVDPARTARVLEARGDAPVDPSRVDRAAPGLRGRGADPHGDRATVSASGPRRVGVALSVAGGVALGLTPKVGGWVQGGLGVSIGRAVIGVHAGHGFARPTDRSALLRAAMTSAGLRGCFAPTQGRLAVPLCGLFEAGAVTARVDVPEAAVLRAPWLGAGIGVGVEWAPHPRIALVGGVDALVAIVRPHARATAVDGSTTQYRVAPAAVRATAGIAFRLR